MIRNKRVSNILIADGNFLFRRGIRTLFAAENDLRVIEEAAEMEEALAKVRVLSPDLLLIDIELAKGEGRRGCTSIRQSKPDLGMLFLAQTDSPEHVELAVEAGARGFMLKNSSPAAIVAGVRQVICADDQNSQGLSKIVPDLRALASSNETYERGSTLTAREKEVTRLLAEGHTVREVASELGLSIKTVEAHKLNLMRKLDIHNRASLIDYALKQGFIPAGPTV